jgi:hypothetical protein
MGAAGRARVQERYCVQKTGPQLARWLQDAARGQL